MANKKDLNVLAQKARTLVVEAGQILLEEKSKGIKVIRKEKKN